MDGTATKDIFYLIKTNPNPGASIIDVPVNKFLDCCGDFTMKALADIGSTDQLKNDINGFLWYFDDVVTAATLSLLKFNGSDYVSVALLDDDDYGTFYDFKFFTNNAGENFIGYEIEWRKVIIAFGEGSYKISCGVVSSLSGNFTQQSQIYCLKQYTASRANGTIRLEYYMNGITGVIDQDDRSKDYGTLNWYNSMRLPGYFGFPDTPMTTEWIKYNNGGRKQVEDDQEPEYVMKLRPVMYFIHETMRIDVMIADKILVTVYNNKVPGIFIQKAIQKSGGHTPDWKKLKSLLAPIEIKWRQEFNNLKKFID